ncbi:MAG: S8 family peptidase [Bacteroidetes bacterium]|nr:S8 family peptidase [Bacteroidota bacterium]
MISKRELLFSIRGFWILLLIHFLIFPLCYTQHSKIHPLLHEFLAQQRKNYQLAKINESNIELYPVIITTNDPEALKRYGIHLNSIVGQYATARLSSEDIVNIEKLDCVLYIQHSSLNTLQTDVSIPEIGALQTSEGILNNTPYAGKDVIVLIYDTGIDWKHLDFRKEDTTKTRILYIWDQTLTPQSGEYSPAGFNYGVEYTQRDIENELDGTRVGFVRTRDYNGHGTHVASIAVGNGRTYNGKFKGVAPEADIIVVKGGDGIFTEAFMIDGLTYAKYKSEQLRKPIVVNWSIGSQYGPHDGTRPYEVAIDSFVTAGRIVCVAAGNDAKYQIHTSGYLSKSSPLSFTMVQPQYYSFSDSMKQIFDFMVWLQGDVSVSGASSLVATIKSPRGVIYSRSKDQHGSANDTSDGIIYLANYKSTDNNHRCIELYVRASSVVPPCPGQWVLTITTSQTSPIEYDAWVAIRSGGRGIPSVELVNGDNQKTITSPGTSKKAITVGSYVTKWSWPSNDGNVYNWTDYPTERTGNISIFSGIGPTRDRRLKPEITAPGQGITAALSSTVNPLSVGNQLYPGGLYKIDMGTSQATPHLVGAVATLLGINTSLSESVLKLLIAKSARNDEFTSTIPNATWGYGKIDLLNAVAKLVYGLQAHVSRIVIKYDTMLIGQTEVISANKKIAIRFVPPIRGTLTGLYLSLPGIKERSISGSGFLRCEIFTAENCSPTVKIGRAIEYPFSLLNPATLNFVPFWMAGVEVEPRIEYAVVLSVGGAGDTLRINTDGTQEAERSLVWDGSRWVRSTSGNYKIRLELTTLSDEYSHVSRTIPETTFELYRNFPNPFNPSTTIQFRISTISFVSLKVFDQLGREIVTLVNEYMHPGVHSIIFNGSHLSSGIYIARLCVGEKGTMLKKSIKMILMK